METVKINPLNLPNHKIKVNKVETEKEEPKSNKQLLEKMRKKLENGYKRGILPIQTF